MYMNSNEFLDTRNKAKKLGLSIYSIASSLEDAHLIINLLNQKD